MVHFCLIGKVVNSTAAPATVTMTNLKPLNYFWEGKRRMIRKPGDLP